jgi:hypothetical protein
MSPYPHITLDKFASICKLPCYSCACRRSLSHPADFSRGLLPVECLCGPRQKVNFPLFVHLEVKVRHIVLGLLFVLISDVCVTAQQSASQHALTKDQVAQLKAAGYVTIERSSAKGVYTLSDPFTDCGFTSSVTDISHPIPGAIGGLVDNVASPTDRVATYPRILRIIGKYDSGEQARFKSLEDALSKLVVIANSSMSLTKKLHAAKPYLEHSDTVFQSVLQSAGIENRGGCGAGPEDSEVVDFNINPKPPSALYILTMQFDSCKRVLTDPYDRSKCDGWYPIEPSDNQLSGTYIYRVTWGDGTVAMNKFSALGTKKKTITITK